MDIRVGRVNSRRAKTAQPAVLPNEILDDFCVGSTLKTARQRLGLSQETVARRAGLSRNHYQLLEAGLSSNRKPANPRLSTLVALAQALEIPPPELIGRFLGNTS